MYDLVISLSKYGIIALGERQPDGKMKAYYTLEGVEFEELIEGDEYELRGLFERV